MFKISHGLIFGLAVLLALATLTACGSNKETTAPGEVVPGISVTITNSTCPSAEIKLNDQVTWTNKDKVEHQIRVEYAGGKPLADLGVLQPGDSASLTFNQAGTFLVYCSRDPGSTGTITVQP